MKDKMVLELLIKAIIYGKIRYDHPYILELENISTIQEIIESIEKENLKHQIYLPDEKNNLFDILGLYRFDYSFSSKETADEMKDWCNRMIEGFNHADSNLSILHKINAYKNHGYVFEQEGLIDVNYEYICSQTEAMSELEFYLMDYLRTDGVASAALLKQFIVEPKIESCIYYLLQMYQGKFSKDELIFFLTIEEARKTLSLMELKNNQCYTLKESTQNCPIASFNTEEVKLIQQFVDLNFSNFLENIIQNELSKLEQKTKKKL